MATKFQLSEKWPPDMRARLIWSWKEELKDFYKIEEADNSLILTPINIPWPPFFSLHKIYPDGNLQELDDCFQFFGPMENRELVKKELEKRPKNLDKLTEFYYTTMLKLALDPHQKIKENLERAAQKFLKQFPKGSVFLIKKTGYFHLAAAIKSMAVFSKYDDRTPQLMREFIKTGSLPASKIHYLEARDFFSLALNFGHNSLYGLSFPHQSHQFIFLFGKRLDMLKRNYRSELNTTIKGFNSASWRDDNSDYYNNISINPGEEYQNQFINGYVNNINNFLAFVYDLQNFPDENGNYNPVTHFNKILNFDMMFDLLNGIKSTNDQFTRNKFFLLFLDVFALTVGKKGSIADLIQGICNPAFVEKILNNAKIGNLFKKKLGIGYAFDQIIKDIYLDEDKPKNKEESELHIQKFLYYLRNTVHGFDLDNKKIKDILFSHNMNIPKELQEIAFLYMMAFMENPKLFWQQFPTKP